MNFLFVLTLVHFVLMIIILEANSSNYRFKKKLYSENKVTTMFSGFLRKFNKNYCNNKTEYNRRLKIFTENIKLINAKNKENDDMQLGITKFSDMTRAEKKKELNCLAKVKSLSSSSNQSVVTDPKFCSSVPAKWDWRDYNLVSPVRDQGDCGSCWAFSTVGALETLHAIKHKGLYTLSVQQLVDCIPRNDCGGGYPHQALQHLVFKNEGIAEERDYPYTGEDGTCQADSKEKKVKPHKSILYKLSNENYLKALVRNKGPIILGMQAGDGFSGYRKGIASSKTFDCVEDDDLAHAVLLVGYGKTKLGKPYWIIKNSYGTQWGEKGYFKLLRGQNACKILSYVVAVEVK